jgi:phosphoribosylamine--glycine ligase
MVDGKNITPMASSQDHKAALDGDKGPNTGGMGAYSPAPVVTPEIHERIMQEVIVPTVEGMAAEGNDYTGFLYAGIMVAPDGTPKVLEYNCRFGDPETQPIMMRMKSDLVELCLSALGDGLAGVEAEFDVRAAVGVVLAAGGYPAAYGKGAVISGIEAANATGCKVFHAGTASSDGSIVTSGGRVICVTALGNSVTQAQGLAYRGVAEIDWDGVYYRNDIAHKAISRES